MLNFTATIILRIQKRNHYLEWINAYKIEVSFLVARANFAYQMAVAQETKTKPVSIQNCDSLVYSPLVDEGTYKCIFRRFEIT